jgi:hypothetical protein
MKLDILSRNLDRIVVPSLNLVVNPQFYSRLEIILLFWYFRVKLTPFPVFIISITGSLDYVVSQDTGCFECVLDLHRRVDACASVLVELLAGFCACGDEDIEVVCLFVNC